MSISMTRAQRRYHSRATRRGAIFRCFIRKNRKCPDRQLFHEPALRFHPCAIENVWHKQTTCWLRLSSGSTNVCVSLFAGKLPTDWSTDDVRHLRQREAASIDRVL